MHLARANLTPPPPKAKILVWPKIQELIDEIPEVDLPLVLQAKADECSLAMAEALLRKAVAEAFGQVPLIAHKRERC